MSKRTTFTTISPLPPTVMREAVIKFLHDHRAMIDLNPLVKERHPIGPPQHSPEDEKHCQWWSLTDDIAYMPGVKGDLTYTAAFLDLPDGIQTHCYAPMGTHIRGRWSVCGTMPGEPKQPRELGLDVPSEGLYIREDVEVRCNFLMASFVKKNIKKSHGTLVNRLCDMAAGGPGCHADSAQNSNSSSSSTSSSPFARTIYDPFAPRPQQPVLHASSGSIPVQHGSASSSSAYSGVSGGNADEGESLSHHSAQTIQSIRTQTETRSPFTIPNPSPIATCPSSHRYSYSGGTSSHVSPSSPFGMRHPGFPHLGHAARRPQPSTNDELFFDVGQAVTTTATATIATDDTPELFRVNRIAAENPSCLRLQGTNTNPHHHHNHHNHHGPRNDLNNGSIAPWGRNGDGEDHHGYGNGRRGQEGQEAWSRGFAKRPQARASMIETASPNAGGHVRMSGHGHDPFRRRGSDAGIAELQ